jgi:hypothetical protein
MRSCDGFSDRVRAPSAGLYGTPYAVTFGNHLHSKKVASRMILGSATLPGYRQAQETSSLTNNCLRSVRRLLDRLCGLVVRVPGC